MKVSRRKNKTPISDSSASPDVPEVAKSWDDIENSKKAEKTLALARSLTDDKKTLAVRNTRKTWTRKLDTHLPEDLLLTRHKELINTRRKEVIVVGMGFAKEVKVIDLGVDVGAVSKGLELAYKLRGKLTGDAPPVPVQNNYNLFFLPEVQAKVRAFEDSLIKSITNDDKAIDVQVIEPDTAGAGSARGDADAGRAS